MNATAAKATSRQIRRAFGADALDTIARQARALEEHTARLNAQALAGQTLRTDLTALQHAHGEAELLLDACWLALNQRELAMRTLRGRLRWLVRGR